VGTAEAAEDRGGLLWDEWPNGCFPRPPFGTLAVRTCAVWHLCRLIDAAWHATERPPEGVQQR